MKVVFRGNDTADVSAIQSVSVDQRSGRIEICVKHKKEKTGKQKVSYLTYPSAKYSRRHLPESAETIAKELESLSKASNMPIEQIAELTAWRNGHLQVRMDADSRASGRGLALLCWGWPLGQNPPTKELEFRTGFKAADIKTVTSTDTYKQSVKDLMLETYNTADFKWWLRDYGRNMPRRFGNRMRLREDAAAELINSIAEQYGIDLGNLKSSWSLSKPERSIGSGRNSVYLYYYQWDRENATSNGLNVWECKIGLAERSLQERLREQVTDPENFKLGLHIQTDDNPAEIEKPIHDELKELKKHLGESLRTEWFLTNPNEVERIYKRI